MSSSKLNADFFARPTLIVARELLGQRLVRMVDGQRLSGIIVETEAYIGEEDTACHASKGRTPRTEVMYGLPGTTYVYVIYGMYHLLNLVTERIDFPAAVLIRALAPESGVPLMQQYRQKDGHPPPRTINLTSGPGKLSQALAIDKALNNRLIDELDELWLEQAEGLPDHAVSRGPRIGLTSAHPDDKAAPWRFWVTGSRFVSR
jgi:DNA-3-methyladenine glycosylase